MNGIFFMRVKNLEKELNHIYNLDMKEPNLVHLHFKLLLILF